MHIMSTTCPNRHLTERHTRPAEPARCDVGVALV